MNSRILASVVTASAAFVLSSCAGRNTDSSSSSACCLAPATGTATTLSDSTKQALRDALMDERRSQAFYNAVMERHGRARPFVNIVRAEECHEGMVAALMERYGVPVTKEAPDNVPVVADTLVACATTAAQAERDNIALYDRLLPSITEPDIRETFHRMRGMSLNNHLPAFERFASGRTSAGALGGGCGKDCRGGC